MLHDPARHEPLTADPWDAARAQAALAGIVDDIERHRGADGDWPRHPQDDDGDLPRGGYKSLYLGSAGVLWTLWSLQRAGAVTLRHDPADGIDTLAARYRDDPDTGSAVPSYLLGEVGVLLVAWRLTGDAAIADRLHAAVESNIDNPTNESLWAAPGTMLAAWHLWAATGDARWRTLFAANVDRVWDTWRVDEKTGLHLWTQDLYGSLVHYFGAGHGVAGNLYPLFKGASLLDDVRRETLYARSLETLAAIARRDGDAVHWPVSAETPRPGRPPVLVQWCHGAPGIVTACADVPVGRLPALDALLEGGGRAVWQAGPLAKGYGLCHGTAGNGHAFLVLHRRTGDAVWLARARAFAMHAIVQRDRARAAQGIGRYSLWTGDAGLADYLWQCLQAEPGLPGLDRV